MTILIVGDVNADVGAALLRFPREGDDCPVRELLWGSGGAGVNVATGLALLGFPARLLARAGHDQAANIGLRAARSAGVDLTFVERDETIPTGLCYAAVSPGGERTFFSYRGANAALGLPDIDDLFRDVSLLHVCGHALLEGSQEATTRAVLAEASRRRVPASLDLCLPLLAERPKILSEIAPPMEFVFANEPELAALSGLDFGDRDPVSAALASIAAVERAYPCRIVAKLGARGSVMGGDPPVVVPAFSVVARDTTGCGDAYAAAFLAAYLRGASPLECARLGNAAGAVVATRPGSADALPSRREIFVFLKERGDGSSLSALFSADSGKAIDTEGNTL